MEQSDTAVLSPLPSCANCDGPNDSLLESVQSPFVYAIGQIEARYPTLGLEKEFAQAVGKVAKGGQTDGEAFKAALTQRENRYLLRKICWVMTIEGLETYILRPGDGLDWDLLADGMSSALRSKSVDVVIGERGGLADPGYCNGLTVPVVYFDQIYSFDVDAFIQSIPRPPKVKDDQFGAMAEELFNRIMQLADNAGSTDDHRALNYLAVRYPAIYAQTTAAHIRNASLTGVSVRRSRLSGVRNVVDVIFTYMDRATTVTESYFVRVDVTEEFPFLVTALMPYFER